MRFVFVLQAGVLGAPPLPIPTKALVTPVLLAHILFAAILHAADEHVTLVFGLVWAALEVTRFAPIGYSHHILLGVDQLHLLGQRYWLLSWYVLHHLLLGLVWCINGNLCLLYRHSLCHLRVRTVLTFRH